jgi:hypothetical protein
MPNRIDSARPPIPWKDGPLDSSSEIDTGSYESLLAAAPRKRRKKVPVLILDAAEAAAAARTMQQEAAQDFASAVPVARLVHTSGLSGWTAEDAAELEQPTDEPWAPGGLDVEVDLGGDSPGDGEAEVSALPSAYDDRTGYEEAEDETGTLDDLSQWLGRTVILSDAPPMAAPQASGELEPTGSMGSYDPDPTVRLGEEPSAERNSVWLDDEAEAASAWQAALGQNIGPPAQHEDHDVTMGVIGRPASGHGLRARIGPASGRDVSPPSLLSRCWNWLLDRLG